MVGEPLPIAGALDGDKVKLHVHGRFRISVVGMAIKEDSLLFRHYLNDWEAVPLADASRISLIHKPPGKTFGFLFGGLAIGGILGSLEANESSRKGRDGPPIPDFSGLYIPFGMSIGLATGALLNAATTNRDQYELTYDADGVLFFTK